MDTTVRRRGLTSALLALGVALTLGCGGGGGGGGGGNPPTQPPPPTTGVTFAPTTGPGASSVFLSHGNPGTSATFVLNVNVQSVTALYAVAFDIRFPAGQLTFTSFSEGGFLNSDGNATSIQVAEEGPGVLVVGVTRLGQVPGIGGSGTLVSLTFQVGSNGSGNLVFDDNSAFRPNGEIKTDVSWIGGTLTVTG